MDITSLTADSSKVTATVNGSSLSVNVTFVADSNTAQIASGDLTVLTDDAIANGTAFNQVQVKVTDANGNPLPDQNVSFTADSGSMIAASGKSDADGQVLMDVSSMKAGTSIITATTKNSTQSVTVTFIADSSTAAITASDLVLLNDSAKANGSDTNVVQVTVKDANGNPVADQSVSFSADNRAVVAANSITDSKGGAIVPVTSTQAGSSAVTASTNGSSQTVMATFVADNSTAQILANDIEVTVNNALSDGLAQNQVMVRVTDANNNVINGAGVAFSATNGAHVAATASTNVDGIVTVPVVSRTAGISQITATINGSSQSVEVTFLSSTVPVITDVVDNAGTVTGTLTSGKVTDDTLPVLNGTSDSNATVRLFDNGKQVASNTANSDGLWSLTPGSALSGDGDHTLTVTSALTSTSDQSPESEAFILNLDTVAQLPTIDSVSDSNGSIAEGGRTNGDNVHLVGTSEPNAKVKVSVVRQADNTHASLGTTVADVEGNWSFTVTDLRVFQESGEFNFTAVTTDVAGNSSKESAMDPFAVHYEAWPAPVGTPRYTLTVSGEHVAPADVEMLLSSTGSALYVSRVVGDYVGYIDLPTPGAANIGDRVYIHVAEGNPTALSKNGEGVYTQLAVGSRTTWYSNGSEWRQIY